MQIAALTSLYMDGNDVVDDPKKSSSGIDQFPSFKLDTKALIKLIDLSLC